VIGEFVEFNVNSDMFGTVLSVLVSFAITFFMLYQIGKIIFPRTDLRKRAVVCTGIILGLAGLAYGAQALQEEKMPTLKIPGDIAYPIRSFSVEKNSFQSFEKSIAKLNADVEKQRLETLEKENKKN
jgi:hypothetical protein